MKKILFFILASLSMTSCYEDYVKDYDNDAIYFPRPFDVRTIVIGEKSQIKVGCVLGGVMENTRNREVNYELNNELVTPDLLAKMKKGENHIKNYVSKVSKLEPLPSNYYTLSNTSSMMIKKGKHTGDVTVNVNVENFISDPEKTLNANYVIPFQIVSADTDSLLEGHTTTVVGLRYESQLYGNYWYGGVKTIKKANGEEVKVEKYYTQIPSPDSRMNVLKTISPYVVETSRLAGEDGKVRLQLNEDGSIKLLNLPDSKVEVKEDGNCSFNKAKLLQDRKIFLSYKFNNPDGTITYANDTLTFRNRVRDGINEWQDENPENYK